MNKHSANKHFITTGKIYWSVICLMLAGTTGLGLSVSHQYLSSIKWKNSPDSNVALANQSIDVLYDKNPISRANKIKFVKLYHEIITKKGDLSTKNATPENVSKLRYCYNHFNNKGSQTNYNKMYAEVLLKYSIQEQFDNLFTDDTDTKLEADVTPMTIAKLNNNTFNDLTTLFVQNPNDAFVARIIKQEKSLNKDINTLNNVAENFNEAYEFKGDKVTLRKDYHKNITSIYENEMQYLKYNWHSTKYMTAIVNVMDPIVKWTRSSYKQHAIYLQDLQAKANAFADWHSTQQQFFNKVAEVHKAAVEQKHYEEKLEKERQAEAKRQKEQKEYSSGYDAGKVDGMNNSEREDLTGESSYYANGYAAGYNAGKKQVQDKKKAEEQEKQAQKDAESSANKASDDTTTSSSSSSPSSSSSSSTKGPKSNNSSNSSKQTTNSSKDSSSSANKSSTKSPNTSNSSTSTTKTKKTQNSTN